MEIGWLVDGETDGAALVLKQLRVIAASSNSGESPQANVTILQRLTALLRCLMAHHVSTITQKMLRTIAETMPKVCAVAIMG